MPLVAKTRMLMNTAETLKFMQMIPRFAKILESRVRQYLSQGLLYTVTEARVVQSALRSLAKNILLDFHSSLNLSRDKQTGLVTRQFEKYC